MFETKLFINFKNIIYILYIQVQNMYLHLFTHNFIMFFRLIFCYFQDLIKFQCTDIVFYIVLCIIKGTFIILWWLSSYFFFYISLAISRAVFAVNIKHGYPALNILWRCRIFYLHACPFHVVNLSSINSLYGNIHWLYH